MPQAAPGLQVERVEGADHAFAVRRRDGRTAGEVTAQVRVAVRDWLARTLDPVLVQPGRQTLT